jgi:Family of unknown function (DUF6788)
MKRLIERRRRLLQKLPPLDEVLRGSVGERTVRCGKPSCRCASGQLHAAVYLSVTHRGGRTEQLSVPRELVAPVRNGVAVYWKWWEIVEQLSAINRDLLRHQRAQRGGAEDGAGRNVKGRRRRPRRAQ